jgi:GNAT superfamily N-acetyltransferase
MADMQIMCRPSAPADFGAIVRGHWQSADEIRERIQKSGIASILAFEGTHCVGHLYVREYDPQYRSPEGWTGGWPWADFCIAEPLELQGRHLTLGCYHVGEQLAGGRDTSAQGRGVGKALLGAAIDWLRGQDEIDGLMAWGLVPGSWGLLQWAGQLPHTVYRKAGFREIKHVRDPRLENDLADVDTSDADEDPALLRVMVLSRGKPSRVGGSLSRRRQDSGPRRSRRGTRRPGCPRD